MNVDLIFRIAAIGIIVAVLNQLLVRSGREEQAMMVTLAGLITVLLMMVYEINTLFTTVKTVFGNAFHVDCNCSRRRIGRHSSGPDPRAVPALSSGCW